MLALAARRELDDVALEHLQQGLLDALVARVGRDGVVGAGLAGDLVELIEVDDAVLGFLDILVGRVVEVADGELDIGADKACLCEARGVRDGERHVEELREVGEQRRLAAAGRAEHDDVRLLDFCAVVIRVAVLHALVVVVDGDGEDLLRAVLVDDVLIEVLLDDVRLVLLEDLVELGGEVRLLFLGRVLFVELDVVGELLDAVLADAEARGRVVDRHVERVVDLDFALAEAAALRYDVFVFFIVCHVETSFLCDVCAADDSFWIIPVNNIILYRAVFFKQILHSFLASAGALCYNRPVMDVVTSVSKPKVDWLSPEEGELGLNQARA